MILIDRTRRATAAVRAHADATRQTVLRTPRSPRQWRPRRAVASAIAWGVLVLLLVIGDAVFAAPVGDLAGVLGLLALAIGLSVGVGLLAGVGPVVRRHRHPSERGPRRDAAFRRY